MITEPRADHGARDLFLWASGFGLGALVMVFFGMVLIGVGAVSHGPSTAPTAATAPASAPAQTGATAPGQTTPAARPQTSGQGQGSAPNQR
jgi:hypothetical protein